MIRNLKSIRQMELFHELRNDIQKATCLKVF